MSPSSSRALVVVMARAPVAGHCKTRLAQSIGDDAAALLAAAFLRDVCNVVRAVAATRWLVYAGEAHPIFAQLADDDFAIHPQVAGDLGARILHLLNEPYEKVCVVGSDSPTLSSHEIARALALLDDAPAVLGPALDGGYWLIGARRGAIDARTFDGVRWSTEHALADTRARLPANTATAATLFDVDDALDLKYLRAALAADPACAPATRAALATLDKIC